MLAFSVVLLRLLLGLLLSSWPQTACSAASAPESQYWLKTPGSAPKQWQLVVVAHHTFLASADDHTSGFSSPWWVHSGEGPRAGAKGWQLRIGTARARGLAADLNGQRQRLRTSIFPNAP
ncbi:hypothetical protein HER32_06040 [Hymenobacter sp. BT18]|uniref:hypothetical protein n=1 Tax=Hymenobacter sp. BT18 TaxID=2835648 RepID=UPI00143E410B|nr:hypothetical protein [Hymenobacter sp. BT18]QIX60759.1 hypothetical protein HER32_06040 [Hymenobacter sp. BT18]